MKKLALILAILSPILLDAQQLTTDDAVAKVLGDWYLRNEVEPALFTPQSGTAHVGGLALTLQANSDDKKAILRLALDAADVGMEKLPLTLAFEVSAPLSEDSSRTVVATPTTLTGMPSGKVGLFWSNKNKKAQALALRVAPQFRQQLNARLALDGAAPESQSAQSLAIAFARRAGILPSIQSLAEDAPSADRWIQFYGATAEGGRKKYKFVNLPDLTAQTAANNSYIGSLVAGVYNLKRESFAVAALRRSRKYKEHDPLQNCVPKDPPTVVDCKPIRNGAPDRRDATVADIELNWKFTDLFGVSPKLAWEFSGGPKTLSLPFYFIEGTVGEKKGILNGGLSFDWTRAKNDAGKEESDFKVTIFVGQFSARPAFIPKR